MYNIFLQKCKSELRNKGKTTSLGGLSLTAIVIKIISTIPIIHEEDVRKIWYILDMRDLLIRFKYLLKGDWFTFWNYHKFGYKQITFRGIPIIFRDDVPKDEMLIHQADGTWKSFNIKSRRIATLKPVDTR